MNEDNDTITREEALRKYREYLKPIVLKQYEERLTISRHPEMPKRLRRDAVSAVLNEPKVKKDLIEIGLSSDTLLEKEQFLFVFDCLLEAIYEKHITMIKEKGETK